MNTIEIWKSTNIKHSILYNSFMIVIVLDFLMRHRSSIFIETGCYHISVDVVLFSSLCSGFDFPLTIHHYEP